MSAFMNLYSFTYQAMFVHRQLWMTTYADVDKCIRTRNQELIDLLHNAFALMLFINVWYKQHQNESESIDATFVQLSFAILTQQLKSTHTIFLSLRYQYPSTSEMNLIEETHLHKYLYLHIYYILLTTISIYLSIYLSIYVCSYLSIYLSIYR